MLFEVLHCATHMMETGFCFDARLPEHYYFNVVASSQWDINKC